MPLVVSTASSQTVQSIFQLIGFIANVAENVRYNKSRCRILAERLQSLSGPLNKCNINEAQAVRLKKTVEKAKKFIEEFARMSILSRVIRRSQDMIDFNDLTSEISK